MIYPKEFQMDGIMWDVDYIMTNNDLNLRNQFLQRIYNKFVNIRYIVGGNKCHKMSVAGVKQMLNNIEVMQKVQQTLHYTTNEVNMIIVLAENEIPFIK